MSRKPLELTRAERDLLRALPVELEEFVGASDPVAQLHNGISRAFARHLAERGLASVSIPAPGRFIVQITENGAQALAIHDALDD